MSWQVRLNISTDNDAFGETREEAAEHVAHILETVVHKLRMQEHYGEFFETLRDVNGNDVGRFAMKPPEEYRD